MGFRARRVATLLAGPVLLALAGVAVSELIGDTAAGGHVHPWKLAWHDEFDGAAGSAPNAGRWRYDLGRNQPGGPVGWGNNELETYTADPANVALDGRGNLLISSTREPGGAWRSARIQTLRADFAPPVGGSMKVEARIELPIGRAGYWPAFWMLGEPFRARPETWPAPGEIDVMENVNNSDVVHGTLHCDTRPDRPCHQRPGIGHSHILASRAGPHIYAVIWDTNPRRLRWQVDGHTFGQLTSADIGPATWDQTFGHGYFLLLNLAIGGDWPGPPDSRTMPGAFMSIDYVRVFTAS